MSDTLLNYTVLFVEDDDEVREKVSLRLQRQFRNVYMARDGEEGWNLYVEKRPDILFLDINLPKLSGIELLKKVREKDYNTKAVMLTAHSNIEYLLQTNQLKLTKYIVKPLTREVLNETINILVKEMSSFKTISLKNLTLKSGFYWNFEQNELFQNGNVVDLTALEKKVFECFAKNSNTILNYDDVILCVWDSFESDKKASLKTLIKNLRRKLPAETIENVFGMGYRLNI